MCLPGPYCFPPAARIHSEHFEDFFEKNMLSSKQNISLVIFREDFKSVV